MDVFTLSAKVIADISQYESGLNKAAEMGKNVIGGIGNIAKVGMGVATAAIGAGTAAMGAFGKSALGAYSNYEQLEGGIQKLYGESDKATARMMENAQKAYKTAGMSANQYMDTAMQFSASMISSLDGNLEEAANMTDVAMRAMSDNVNVFGSNMQDVSNAFKGFSKANFTMLDNLKLGYGGTKEEMERLLRDAEKYEGYIENSLDVNNFADIVDAIQIVQEHLNIAGTTGREAMTTIEGSANMTKAAWENLKVAIADGEGITEAFSGLKDAIFGIGLTEDGKETGLLNQIVPRIQTIMEGAGEALVQAAPTISQKIPELINAVLPTMLDGGISLAGALGKGLIDAAPSIWESAESAASTIGDYLSKGMETAAKATEDVDLATPIGNALDKVDELLNGEKTQKFIEDGVTVVSNLAQGIGDAAPDVIPKAVDIVTTFADNITDNIPTIIEAGGKMAVGIAEGVIQAAPKLILAVFSIKAKIIGYFAEMAAGVVQKAVEGFNGVIQSAASILPQLPEKIAYYAGYAITRFVVEFALLPTRAKEIFNKVIDKAKEFVKDMEDKAKEAGDHFGDKLLQALGDLVEKAKQKAKEIANAIGEAIKGGIDAAGNFISNFGKGQEAAINDIKANRQQNTLNASLFDDVDSDYSIATGGIDYDQLGRAIVKAFTEADIAVECDSREFGRLVRKAVLA